MSIQQTQLRPPSRLTSALAGKVVIPEHAGFDEMSMSARTRQAVDAVADVAGGTPNSRPGPSSCGTSLNG